MCDAFGIPVVTLVDSEGVTASDSYENAPYAAELAKLAYAYSTAETAKVTVVLGRAYGSAFVLMGSKSVGADIAFALDTAKISILSRRRQLPSSKTKRSPRRAATSWKPNGLPKTQRRSRPPSTVRLTM